MSSQRRDVITMTEVPPRISHLGHNAVSEIATRCRVSKEVVLQAMLLTSLENQRALMANIEKLRGHEADFR